MKNQFKGTPGPWKIAGRGEKKIGIDVSTQTTGAHHIDVWHSEYGWPQKEEAEANANLIAAAPELLEALQSLMDSYDKNGHLLNFNVDIARQAINKALAL